MTSIFWLVEPALAQQGDEAGAPPAGDCEPSPDAHECAERCPSFETCSFQRSGELAIYYQVNDQRFDCSGIDCVAATRALSDYCCRRGQFAPETEAGESGAEGGCAIPTGPGKSADQRTSPGLGIGLWVLISVAIASRQRARGLCSRECRASSND